MSKLRSDKINFNNDDFVVEVEIKKHLQPINNSMANDDFSLEKSDEEISSENLVLNRAKEDANSIIESAQIKADNLIQEAKTKALSLEEEIIKNANLKANEILEKAKAQAEELIDKVNIEKENLIKNSADEIEQKRIEEAHRGYQEGYEDAQGRIIEELEEKIQNFDNFCSKQYEIKNKILKTAGKDIFDIITNISKKILSSEPDAKNLETIIQKTISLLEKKENINIILSEKYAKVLFGLQNKNLDDELEFKFEEFKQYKGFDVLYNPELNEDTIIIETPEERFDASINSQLDVIIRDILKNSKNGYLETDEYLKEDETN